MRKLSADRDTRYDKEIENRCRKTAEVIADDVQLNTRIAAAAAIIGIGAFIAVKATGIGSLLVITALCGVTVVLAVIDIISDMIDMKTIKHNLTTLGVATVG